LVEIGEASELLVVLWVEAGSLMESSLS